MSNSKDLSLEAIKEFISIGNQNITSHGQMAQVVIIENDCIVNKIDVNVRPHVETNYAAVEISGLDGDFYRGGYGNSYDNFEFHNETLIIYTKDRRDNEITLRITLR